MGADQPTPDDGHHDHGRQELDVADVHVV